MLLHYTYTTVILHLYYLLICQAVTVVVVAVSRMRMKIRVAVTKCERAEAVLSVQSESAVCAVTVLSFLLYYTMQRALVMRTLRLRVQSRPVFMMSGAMMIESLAVTCARRSITVCLSWYET